MRTNDTNTKAARSATARPPIRALYISTEGEAPTERLLEIAEYVAYERQNAGYLDVDADMLLDNVFVEPAETADDLWELLHQRVPVLVRAHGVRLVVIDSIAAVFRADFRNNRAELSERKDWFFGLASAMKVSVV
jgi:DNA-repair protein XRCC3